VSKTIWKFEVRPKTMTQLPEGAEILSAASQGDSIFIWAVVDPEAPKSGRLVNVYGTGHDIPDYPGKFIGTVMLYGGSLVFHIFDAGPA